MWATALSSSSRTAGLLTVGSTFTTSTLGTSSGPSPAGASPADHRCSRAATPLRESPMAQWGLPFLGVVESGCRVPAAADSALTAAAEAGKPESARRDYLRTLNRRMVTAPDRVLLTGSRSTLGRPGGEKRMPSPSSTGR